jgi:taurine dioxygenase
MALSVKALDAPLGAEIEGLDTRAISREEAQALNAALLEHHLLVIRNQPTADADLVELGKCFGPIVKARMVSPLTGRDDIMVISNIREDGKPVGQLPDGEMAFHIDQIYKPNPCRGAALHAVEIPGTGGATLFSNNVRAYNRLPEEKRKRLDGLMATHSFQYGETLKENRVAAEDRPHFTHPLVRRIPENGNRALAVCRLMTDQIEGLDEAESRALIEELCDAIEDPSNVYGHEWRVGDILIWDNRCTSHARTDFPTTERRLMKRVTIGDTQPPLA